MEISHFLTPPELTFEPQLAEEEETAKAELRIIFAEQLQPGRVPFDSRLSPYLEEAEEENDDDEMMEQERERFK